MQTYHNLYLNIRKKLRAAGITAHDIEARLIVSSSSGKTREELLNVGKDIIADSSIIKAASGMAERRLAGEPIAYILGEWEFYGIPILVSSSVLIPRVDTEVLADEAISILSRMEGSPRVLDLCTGSGCVGLAVAAHVPECRVVLADNSPSALSVCRANMLKNKLTKNTLAISTDALGEPPDLLGTFDAIICNPPYIPAADIAFLDRSVRDYEPLTALAGGPDGLDFFRAVTENWARILNNNSFLAFECGDGQAEEVCRIMSSSKFTDIRAVSDTLGIERVIIGNK